MTDSNNPSNWDRRSFLKFSTASLAVAAASGATLSSAAAAELLPAKRGGMINKNSVILFQGDSITDAGRSRDRADVPNLQPGLGNGYAWLAASQLLVDYAGSGLKIYNRGISGHKVFQLAERWDKECIDMQPDVLSILIGVNDIWHMLSGNYGGTLETYEKDYRALLARTRKALPKTKIIVCEPFVLRCGAVTDKWFPLFDGYRAAAEKLAKETKASFVPFQAMFDEAVKYAPAEHWAADGVHPTPAGAALMAHYWLRVVSR
jgi:lysophospholipase L1-like esterase